MSDEKKEAAKPGIKSTEFWISLIVMAVGAVMASGVFGENVWVQVAGAVAMAIDAAAYTQGRSLLKKEEAKK